MCFSHVVLQVDPISIQQHFSFVLYYAPSHSYMWSITSSWILWSKNSFYNNFKYLNLHIFSCKFHFNKLNSFLDLCLFWSMMNIMCKYLVLTLCIVEFHDEVVSTFLRKHFECTQLWSFAMLELWKWCHANSWNFPKAKSWSFVKKLWSDHNKIFVRIVKLCKMFCKSREIL